MSGQTAGLIRGVCCGRARRGARGGAAKGGTATGAGSGRGGLFTGKNAGKTRTPGDLLSTGRIELAEVTGGHSREYKLPDTHFAVAIPAILVRPPQQQPQLDAALWPAIAERARYASLRDLAAEYGVSHETVRAIVRRGGSALADVAAD